MRIKCLITIGVVFSILSPVYAQLSKAQQRLADLYGQLQATKDTAHINVLTEIANIQLRRYKMDSAFFYYTQAKKLALPAGFYKGMFEADNNLGSIYMHRQQHDSAIHFYLESLSHTSKMKGDNRYSIAEAKQGI